MSNLNNLIKENYQLKAELDNMIRTVKENEVKHNGFKTVQHSFLLSRSLKELSETALRYLEEIFDLDKVVLYLKDGSYSALSCSFSKEERVFLKKSEAFDYTFLNKRAFFGSNPLILHSSLAFPDYDGAYSYVIAPVIESGNITAAIGLYSQDTERFTVEQNVDFINEFTMIVAIALRKLDNSRILEMQAQTDYLTGLPNKSMLEIAANKVFADYQNNGKPFSFILLDLDNFKQVNDVKGHLVGDDVLKKVATSIRQAIGSQDILGRFGGDEFYLFTELSDDKDIMIMADKIKKAVSALSFHMDIPKSIGISAGVAKMPDDKDKAATFMEIVKLADERLYIAKQGGKGAFIGVTDDNK